MKSATSFIAHFATLLFLLSTFGCSSAKKNFEKDLAQGNCEAASRNIPEQKDLGIKVINRTQQAGGTLISYAFTGVSYTAEVLWDFTGGTVMFIGLCGPSLFAESASSSNGTYSSHQTPLVCLPGKFTALSAPPLGRDAFSASENLRCPNVSPLVRSLQKLTACYAAHPNAENFQKAQRGLLALKSSGNFYRCVTKQDQEVVDRQLSSIAEKLSKETD